MNTAPDLSRYQQGMKYWCSACHKFFGEIYPGSGNFHREDDDIDRCPHCFGSDEDCIYLDRDGVKRMCGFAAHHRDSVVRAAYAHALWLLLDEHMHFEEA